MTIDNSQTILKLRTGQEIILPQRKDLLGGLKFTRRFSHNEVHPYDEVDWTRRDVRIMDWKTGKTIYERLGLEAPAHWDDNAVKITADKYLFGSEPGSLEYEDSFRNIYDRISNTYTVWGWEEGYFATLEDAAHIVRRGLFKRRSQTLLHFFIGHRASSPSRKIRIFFNAL